jgi:hypothetical protein
VEDARRLDDAAGQRRIHAVAEAGLDGFGSTFAQPKGRSELHGLPPLLKTRA